MRRLLRASLVIARRDYTATVWSRSFLLFLLGPLLPIAFGGGMGLLAGQDAAAVRSATVQVAMGATDARLLAAARARLALRLGDDAVPRLARGKAPPRLEGSLDRPRLVAADDELPRLERRVALLLDTARGLRAGAPPPVTLAERALAAAPAQREGSRAGLGRGAQIALFFATLLLSGWLISNLVEEKSSKVIELLAAAVPVDALFLGKLVGMLAVSLTALAAWGTAAGLAAAALLPAGQAPPAPAVGWPAFALLGLCYFVMLYLLTGALYLSVGAQAGTVREVQTLSLPLTVAQLLFFGLASVGVRHGGGLAIAAAAIPWSSPLLMIARAAAEPAWWPHLLALGWQIVLLAVAIRLGAGLFRANILAGRRTR